MVREMPPRPPGTPTGSGAEPGAARAPSGGPSRDLFDRYLRLLGITRSRPSLQALREVTLAHLTRVPFENVSKLYLRKQSELRGLPGLERFLDGIERQRLGDRDGADVLPELLGTQKDVVILDARSKRADYDTGHLVGARHAELERQLSCAADPDANPARGGRHPLPGVEQWRRTLGGWGISPTSLVVAYDDQAGANAAARAWWMLRSVCHERVAVLDGGLEAARSVGLATTTVAPTVDVKPPYPTGGWQRPTVDLAAVDERRKDLPGSFSMCEAASASRARWSQSIP